MEAYLVRRYGGPAELAEVPDPIPKDDEVLVKVLATSVTAGDWRVRTLETPRGFGKIARLALGLRRPRQPILGTELSGVVEAVGARVTRLRPGDEVFAFPGGKIGCHAQLRAVAQAGPIARKPAKLSFEEAASLSFGGTTALHFLRAARVQAGERVLVVGAAGGVGTALVQLARHQGARVTGVTSAANVDLVTSLGAERVIDRASDDPLADAYDVIADTVGAIPVSRAKRALRPGGRLLAISASLPDMIAGLWTSEGRRVIAGPAAERAEDVQHLADLAEGGALRPVVDRVYAWEEMNEAHAYVATRRKRGSVIVRVRQDR